jgi:hypothetical protein
MGPHRHLVVPFLLARVAIASADSGDAASVTAPAEAPAKPVAGGLTLAAGAFNITTTVEMSASETNAMTGAGPFKPLSIAPDLSYGATRDLTVSVIHSAFGYSGFRGVSGYGLCATDGCPNPYHNFGFEGLYALTRGDVASAVDAGVHTFFSGSSTFVKVKLGGKMKLTAGRFYATFQPSVDIAVDDRGSGNKDQVFLPVAAAAKVTSAFAAGVGSGLKLMSLSSPGPGGSWLVPLGAFGQYKIGHGLDVGASFVFGKLAGADTAKPGIEDRHVQVWLSYTTR